MKPYLLAFQHTPTVLERLVDQVPVARYSESVGPDRFTLTEVVAHLADWEDVVLDRLRMAVEHPGSTVAVYDETLRAIEKRYAEKDIHHEIAVFANRRRDTVTFVSELTPDQLALTIVHPERGTETILDQVLWIYGHDLYHLEQVSAYLTELHALVP